MTNQIISLAFAIFGIIGKCIGIFIHKLAQSALIIPTTVPESTGDETMALVVLEHLKSQGRHPIGIVCHQRDGEWQYLDAQLRCTPPVQAGMKHLLRNAPRMFVTILALSRYEEAYCNPGDTLDGHYDRGKRNSMSLLLLLYLLANAGVKVRIMGCSINAHPTDRAMHALRIACRKMSIIARDPVTYERMQQHRISNAVLGSDLGFLLQPAGQIIRQKHVMDFIREHRNRGAFIAGINPHFLQVRSVEEKKKMYLALQGLVIAMLAQHPAIVFVFLPHDNRSYVDRTENGFEITRNLLSQLPAELREKCVSLVPEKYSSMEIRTICGNLDVCIAGSMHLAIACLRQSVPTLCVAYQDKFEGLYLQFDISSPPLLSIEEFLGGCFAEKIGAFMQTKESVRDQISRGMQHVIGMARKNFEER